MCNTVLEDAAGSVWEINVWRMFSSWHLCSISAQPFLIILNINFYLICFVPLLWYFLKAGEKWCFRWQDFCLNKHTVFKVWKLWYGVSRCASKMGAICLFCEIRKAYYTQATTKLLSLERWKSTSASFNVWYFTKHFFTSLFSEP